MGPLDKYVLADDALTATPTGFALKFKSHWYRSLPLSCMEPALSLNGQPVDPATMTVEANGNTYPVADMPNLDREWLFIQDAATLHVRQPKSLDTAKSYEVTFTLSLYIPYVLVGPEANPLLASSRITKTLISQ